MTEFKANQSGNLAGGDIAGRDITHIYDAGPSSTLRQLAEKFRVDCDKDEHLTEFIEKLQHFLIEPPGTDSKDLQQKLCEGGRQDLVSHALALKEQFVKKLFRLQFSPQAQELFAHILSHIHTFFILKVKPLILENAPRSEVDALIFDELISKLYEQIGTSELDVTMNDLIGMVYFLAGNCHIEWK